MNETTNSIRAAFKTPEHDHSEARLPLAQWAVRWLLFFLICLGLGYAGVVRYQPRTAPGLSDSSLYYRLVAGEEVQGRDMRFRILVPNLARPFYLLGKRFLSAEQSLLLALLIANAIFCATTCCLLVGVALRLTGNSAVALLAACLYLLNFAIANLQLAGLVDTGEACFMMALTWSLLLDRWWLLPVWGLFGALAKETYVPLAGVFTLGWWLSSQRHAPDRRAKIFWATAMIVLGILAIIISRVSFTANITNNGISTVAGGVAADGTLFQINPGASYWSRLVHTFSSRTFWYVFVWLLPLGVAGLKCLPRRWVIAATMAAVLALALGLYKNIDGNVARPLFDVLGPLLSLSAAIWLSRALGPPDSLRVE
jgi:hypothetical protein